jgi:hypothetical protein
MALKMVAAVIEIGVVYCVDDAVGVVPSVVKWMVAPAVVVLMDTTVPETTAPAPGLNVGVAATGRIVYIPDRTAEGAKPAAMTTALIVVGAVMAIGVVYCVDDGVGSVPSMVK